MSYGWVPSTTKLTTPAAEAALPMNRMPSMLLNPFRACAASIVSWSMMASAPMPLIQFNATPKAIAPLMCGVPASNLWGRPA